MNRLKRIGACAVVAGALASVVASAALPAEPPLQRVPLTLKASDVLPPDLIKGEGFQVKDKVSNDGFQNTYSIRTDYGTYSVTGDAALRARIQEV